MSDFDAPQSRNEAILQNMLGAENELGDPQSRIEELLMQLLEVLKKIDGYEEALNASGGEDA